MTPNVPAATALPAPPPAVVVDTRQSPHAALRPVPVAAVTITDRFWTPRRTTNRQVTIPSQARRNEETGRIDNFRRAAGQIEGEFQGRYFNDSDVYKWLEAVGWALAAGPDPALSALAGPVIDVIAAAQEPNGYLNTYFTFARVPERWTNFDLHEMYCAGHLIQGAIAWYRATGDRRLLDVAIRFADHIIDTFGPEAEGKREMTDGHPEVELALVELARTTGDPRYLAQAQFFVDVRGYNRLGRPYDRWGPPYHQDHIPFREWREFVGHAVRAIYLTCGATDVETETGEGALLDSLHALWRDLVTTKLYVTGGIGARYEGEAFGEPFELPNDRAYTETCAAIASVMWNWRLFLREADPRYVDLLEHTLYNAVLPGVSLAGDTYFYQNPIADEGKHQRQTWFGTACCPPNIARMLASLPGYVYAVANDAIWVNLYAAGTATLTLGTGQTVHLIQTTDYPWDGRVIITVDAAGEFALHLRISGWVADNATLTINGEAVGDPLTPGHYVTLRRTWAPGDLIELVLPMPVRRLRGHPTLEETTGRVALMRGPLLYCLEGVDHPGVPLDELRAPAAAAFTAAYTPDLLGGTVVLHATTLRVPLSLDWAETLYRPEPLAPDAAGATADGSSATTAQLTAIPYCLWANRAPGQLRIWLPAGE